MDLPSSGDAALTMAKVPSEFGANQPTFVFQGKVETRGRVAIFPREGASSMAGGSGRDLAHLLWAALLPGGMEV